ncbi:hypothetical protein S4054249_09915 [Pseudoalteromonas luteoviolacea]|uniref:Uncharacterized protein n=1 Tax=Pseudoalteromonas luteoviolacea S4054 TaxID=1129367 RepID=A0A0F6AEB3_9GAMM|nr:hypothetical protein S4054249_09915 [Pseudoalteromonas luteoviolacea]AOT13057.1 hypothetical protein S40542_09915 [Pseudoalteromonas luteoviolacea]AOT17969.1 hypothetical protein S4054_09910 [Pseudoalteromonas luteoviolacea]KKE84530.1 hypothetical protein N479_08890 [Pseudoalteromonas luteoviolacea S4054]KZN69495.1 hypothetical protein N481_22145 [Pseudoalteromonas luteoviolacea S4047-1]
MKRDKTIATPLVLSITNNYTLCQSNPIQSYVQQNLHQYFEVELFMLSASQKRKQYLENNIYQTINAQSLSVNAKHSKYIIYKLFYMFL